MTQDKNLKNVGESLLAREASWSFGEDTPKNFSEHIQRSVPYYADGHHLVCQLSDFFIKNDSRGIQKATGRMRVASIIDECG